MKRGLHNTFGMIAALAGMLILCILAGALAACGSPSLRTLRFETGEETAAVEIRAAAGEKVFPPEAPAREGYSFEGWYLDEEGAGERQTPPSVMPDEDRTYYAKWEKLPAISLDLGGGTLADGPSLYLKAGSDLYSFMQTLIPERKNCKFHAWMKADGEPLTEGDRMPADGAALSAAWEVRYTVKIYRLDFAALNGETGAFDLYREEGAVTGYALPGTTIDGSENIPAHYTLNTEKTVPMSVKDGEENLLSAYYDPIYTRYEDVFGGGDVLFRLEAEADVLYLGREDQTVREKSAEYDEKTGVFTFAAQGGASRGGKISGGKFYYFGDVAGRTYSDGLGSGAKLSLEEGGRAMYIPEEGESLFGSYLADMGRGVFVMMLDEGLSLEFVLAEGGDADLRFRLGDGSADLRYGGEYIVCGDTLLLYLGEGESFRIPEGVYTIGASAFILDGAQNLTAVDFNETVRIEPRALIGAAALSSIEGDIEQIGRSAFEGLKSLERVDLPKIRTVAARAFFGCDALTSVKFAAVERIGKRAFSRSLEGAVPLTLDLAAAADLTGLTVAEDAFAAISEGEGKESVFIEGSAVLVKDLEALNAAIGAFGEAFSPMPISIVAEDVDTMSGVAFYDLLENALYLFQDRKVTKNLYINYGWNSEPVYEYYIEGDAARLYAFDEAQKKYVSFGTCTKDSPFLPVGGKEILPLGAADSPVTLTTADDGGKEIALTYYVTLNLMRGINLNKYVTGVNYEGVEATGVNFTYSGELTFTAEDRAYRGTVGGGVIRIEYLGREYVLEDTSDPAIHYRSNVRVDEEGNLTVQKMEFNDDPSAEDGGSYKTFYGSKVEGENRWKYEQDGYLLQFSFTLGEGNVPSLKGEILGYVVSQYFFSISYVTTLKVEGGKITGLVEFRERYKPVDEKDLSSTIAEDGLSIDISTKDGIYRVTLTQNEGKISLAFTALEFTQNTVSDEQYEFSADLRFKVEGEEKVLIAIAHLYNHYNEIGIISQALNEDHSVTVETEAGERYRISLGKTSYGYECIIVEPLS